MERWKQRSLDFVIACVEDAAAQGRIPRGLPAREVMRFGEAAAADRAWAVIRRMLEK